MENVWHDTVHYKSRLHKAYASASTTKQYNEVQHTSQKSTNERTVSIRIKHYIQIIPKFVESPFKEATESESTTVAGRFFHESTTLYLKANFLKTCVTMKFHKFKKWPRDVFLLARTLSILEVTLTILKTPIISLLSLLYRRVRRIYFCSLRAFSNKLMFRLKLGFQTLSAYSKSGPTKAWNRYPSRYTFFLADPVFY